MGLCFDLFWLEVGRWDKEINETRKEETGSAF